jgi:hypothetical protein
MAATYIPKFNELKGGHYFTCYDAVISDMVKAAEGRQGEKAYVSTPHLDKTWHRILPYITEDKRKQDEIAFFHGFWLAIAYGLLKVDKRGDLYLEREIDGGHGNTITDDVPLLYKGKPVGKTNVSRAIEVLKVDKVFTGVELPALEQKLADELEEMVHYVDTEVFKGLVNQKEDLHPINLVARYNESLGRDKFTSAALISALEKIASELAEHYNMERSDRKLEEAKFGICRRIYDSSKRIKGKSAIFGKWEQMFKQYKIGDLKILGEESEGDSAE